MRIENYIRIIAGSFIMLTVVLSYFHSAYWLFGTLFVGANLFQYGFTGWCPMKNLLKAFGVKE